MNYPPTHNPPFNTHAEFLDWAEGTVKTPAGDVRVSWERRGEKLDLRVEAPEGIHILK